MSQPLRPDAKHTAASYEPWEAEAKRMIEREMIRRDIRYKQLSRMLEESGVYESPDQLNRKINRRRFSAAFFIACMRAMGVDMLDVRPDK